MSQKNWIGLATVVAMAVTVIGYPRAQGADPAGILEFATSTDARAPLTPADLQTFLPERGQFTFPAPYNTTGVRLTNQHDCGEWYDCVNTPTGGSWQNMNNSAGSDLLYIAIGLDKSNGGVGPSLFRYDKTTGETVALGGLFDPDDDRNWGNLDGWYFSPSRPTTFYVGLDQQLSRYDILTHATSTVFDITDRFGDDKEVYHAHTSADDRVHSFTLRLINNYEPLGCGVYREDTQQFSYFPAVGAFHECQIDKRGQWLLIKEDRDNSGGEDNRIVNLYTGAETVLLRGAGAAGESDNGFDTMVAADATDPLPGAIRTWAFGPLTPGPVVSHGLTGLPPAFTQISFANARSASLDQQYACGGVANRGNGPRANEIACVRLDGSLATLTIAPTMTDLDALGGGAGDDLIKQPFGNLDPTGQFFLWTTNLLGDRIDALLVKVPSARLVTTPADTTVPTVAITGPIDAATVSGGTVSLTATASDNVGVTGVQFQLDGAALGTEVASAPFAWSWDTASTTDGVHVLTALARDAAGNFTMSLPVTITVLNTPNVPQISNVGATGVIERLATVRWTTNQLTDSLIEYGPTAAYGSATTLDPALTAAHLHTLTGLSAGTTYHYRVTSKNAQGTAATSGDFTFRTQSAPAISGVTASALTTSSATISWATDIPSDTMIEYGVTTAYGNATNADLAFVTTHAQGIDNLDPATTYHYRVYSTTPEGVQSVSQDVTFATVAPPIITAVGAVNLTTTTAAITWSTDQPANSAVDFGPTSAYGSTTGADGAFVLAHARSLAGLTAGATYHYRVRSANNAGQPSASGDYTFSLPVTGVINVTSSAADGPYGVGKVVPIQITFSAAVTVTGAAQLALGAGAGAVANYASGSGTTALTFNYIVAVGQSSPDLDSAAANALTGTIRDLAGRNVGLTVPVGGAAGSLSLNKNLVIDTTAPTVTNVTSSAADGTYGVGAVIPIQVTFSKPVVVTGSPRLNTNTNVLAGYASGSGTATLTFNYTVAQGQATADLNYGAQSALSLGGATIKDPAANNAVLTLPALTSPNSLGSNKNIVIDANHPYVVSVSSLTANGTYGAGAVIPIYVTFSQPVYVTGAPQLTLALNPNVVVTYSGGSGSSVLSFNYTVAAGQSSPDLDYASTDALSLNSGTIQSTQLKSATLTLPAPGTSGSLGFNKNIVIFAPLPGALVPWQ